MTTTLHLSLLGSAAAIAVPPSGRILIGRARDVALRLEDPSVSRRHACVHAGTPPQFEQLGDKNPSVLYRGGAVRQIAEGQRVPLAGGDVIKLGNRLIGVHQSAATAAGMVADLDAFERRIAAACTAGSGFGVLRVQLATGTASDLAQAALFALVNTTEGVACSVLGVHDLSLLVELDAAAAEIEVQHLATQLDELGMRGEVGLAMFPRDGTTSDALLGVATEAVETIRAWTPATPIASLRDSRRWAVPLTSFVGRGAELDRVQVLLAGSRLVTVYGAPGIGKSRLALRHAAGTQGHTIVCDLEAATDLAAACAALCSALEIVAPPDQAVDRIGRALAMYPEVLVVLDAAESVAGVLGATLDGWLRRAAGARFLVTSRELLGIAGEASLELEPLPVPADPNDLAADALRLFCDRARLAPDALSDSARSHVATLVRRLDGIPLAIELAAGCLDVYGPADLAALPALLDEIDRGEHGRSLRGALERSWARLGDAERACLAALVVFDADFSLAAAAAVTGIADVASILTALRRKSWLRGIEASDGRRRFALYASVRAYLGAHAAAGAADRHTAYVTQLARRALAATAGVSEVARELEQELANLRTAHGRACTEPIDRDAALAIATALAPVLTANGRLDEVLALLDRALALPGTGGELDAFARIARAGVLHERGAGGEARADLERLRADRAPRIAGRAEAMLARVIAPVDPRAAAELGEAALGHLRGDVTGEITASLDLAAIRIALEELEAAARLLQDAAARADAAGDLSAKLTAELRLGGLAFAAGRLAEAERVLRDAVAHAAALGAARHEARASQALASLLQETGSLAEADAYYRRALEVFRRLDDRVWCARIRGAIGTLLHEQGEHAAARTWHDDAIAELARADAPGLLAVVQCALVAALGELDQIAAGEQVLAEAIANSARAGSPRSQDRLHALARAHLTVARARAAEAAGDADGAARLRDEAAQVAAHIAERRPGAAVRCGQRMLARALGPPQPRPAIDRLVIRDDARTLILPSGARVDLTRHASLRRMVLALARRQREGIAAGLTTDDLLACGWPGDRVEAFSGAARVRVALSRLRSLGLRDLIVRGDDGYVIPSSIVIELPDA